VSCQIQCQEAAYPQCKSDFTDTCTTQCDQTDGALFCDGNYVDVGGNLNACVDALNALLNTKITITASATGSASCSGNECEAQGTGAAKATCSASPSPASGGTWGLLGGMLAITVAAARRRSKR
jgi:MYXO-CTERM domain-containing protein